MSEPTWEDVEALIEAMGDEFRVMWATETKPDDAMIAAAEAALEVTFAADYRAFLRRYGVMYVDVKEDTWRRPVLYEVRPAWQSAYGRIVAGVAPGVHPDLSVVARTQAARERGAADTFVAVLGEVVGAGDWLGYDGDALVEWLHDGDAEPRGETLAAHVLASLQRLVADRERLKTEPIAPAEPAASSSSRSYALSLLLDHDRDARLAAVEAAVAALRADHEVRLELELIGTDDDGNDRVPDHELTLVDLVDDEDALAHLYVDGLETQLTLEPPFSGDGIELYVGVLGDPRELPVGAKIHAVFEREAAQRGTITRQTRNWETWGD